MAKSAHDIVSGPRWLLRLAIVGVVVTFMMAAAWTAWWYDAKRRCDRGIAELRARGEMVSWDELRIVEVPDEQNAATYYRKASAALKTTATPASSGPSAYQRAMQARSNPASQPASRPVPSPLLTSEANVTNNAEALALMRKARAYKQSCWTSKPPAGSSPTPPAMTNASALAKLVHDAALLHHAKGEDAEVIECWRDIDAQARSIGPGQTSLIAGLVSLILDGIGLDALEQITPELRIDAADGASPEAIREVLVLLSNDGEARDAVARGFLAGRTAWADTYLKGTLGNPPSLVQPFVMLQWKRYGDLMARCAAEVREMRVSQSPPLDECDRLIGIIPQFTNVASETNQNVLKRRVLLVALAIRLYHHDHAVYPERLEQLVPEYIRAVPVDLHRVDGGPLGYLLEANGTRPVIYSVAGQRRAEEIRRGLPRTRAKLGSNSMADIQYFDVSAWLGTDSVSQGVHNQVEQSNAPRDSNQPDNDGKQK